MLQFVPYVDLVVVVVALNAVVCVVRLIGAVVALRIVVCAVGLVVVPFS